jgi:hypothetical protein
VTARADEPKKEAPPVKPPTFKAPKGWEPLGANLIATAQFRVGEGETAVKVTVIALPGEGGGWVANVNRWRAQVRLESLDEKEALKLLQPIKVDGLAGYVLDVTGPAKAGEITQRVVAVVVKNGETTWFVKMGGPAVDVADQKKAFDEFVKSIRFEK